MSAPARTHARETAPSRRLLPVGADIHLVGERLVLLTRGGTWRHDLRAVSNVHPDGRGRPVIKLAPEGEWYLLALTGSYSDGTLTGKTETHPADRVWVEAIQPAAGDTSALM